ncbi:MAG: hypothetical protein ACYYK0_02770 [Candidatus Eutrophobiaceae bacterium]
MSRPGSCLCRVGRRYRRQIALVEGLDLAASAGLPLVAWFTMETSLCAACRGERKSAEQCAERHDLEAHDDWRAFWGDLRSHRLSFFTKAKSLWRYSLPMWSVLETADAPFFCDWGGAQYWLASDRPAAELRAHLEISNASSAGHATLFRGGERGGDIFPPLSAPMLALHQRIKHAFDPAGVFNPGRWFPEF